MHLNYLDRLLKCMDFYPNVFIIAHMLKNVNRNSIFLLGMRD